MLPRHVKPIHVVQAAVIGFGDDRGVPPGWPTVLHHPGDGGVAHDANAVCVRDRYGSIEQAALFQPRRACHFAGRVEGEPAGEDRIGGILAEGVDRGDARPNGPGAHLQGAVTLDQGTWPTSTPATSVIAFNGPGVPSNGMPRSLARVVSAVAGATPLMSRAVKSAMAAWRLWSMELPILSLAEHPQAAVGDRTPRQSDERSCPSRRRVGWFGRGTSRGS